VLSTINPRTWIVAFASCIRTQPPAATKKGGKRKLYTFNLIVGAAILLLIVFTWAG
jgi:hypothetical protein